MFDLAVYDDCCIASVISMVLPDFDDDASSALLSGDMETAVKDFDGYYELAIAEFDEMRGTKKGKDSTAKNVYRTLLHPMAHNTDDKHELNAISSGRLNCSLLSYRFKL